MILTFAIFLSASFFLGAIPFGLVISRLHSGIDLRATGSGNIGATNVARTLGAGMGVLTLFLDMAKGLGPVLLAGTVFTAPETIGYGIYLKDAAQAACGFSALLGHCYSPFLKFRGGKGVATALGAFLGMVPLAVVVSLAVFVAVTARWGFVSAGSLSAALIAPIAAWLIGYPPVICLSVVAASALIWLRHKDNIRRLVLGQEKHWRKKKPA